MFLPVTNRQELFRDKAIVIPNLKYEYILGQVLHRAYRFSTGYSTTEKHYIMVNGEMITEVISQVTECPIIKNRGTFTLPLMSVSVISVKIPPLQNINNVYNSTVAHSSYQRV